MWHLGNLSDLISLFTRSSEIAFHFRAGVPYQNNQLTIIIIQNNVTVTASQNVAATLHKQHILLKR
jgi:hypothetical protein